MNSNQQAATASVREWLEAIHRGDYVAAWLRIARDLREAQASRFVEVNADHPTIAAVPNGDQLARDLAAAVPGRAWDFFAEHVFAPIRRAVEGVAIADMEAVAPGGGSGRQPIALIGAGGSPQLSFIVDRRAEDGPWLISAVNPDATRPAPTRGYEPWEEFDRTGDARRIRGATTSSRLRSVPVPMPPVPPGLYLSSDPDYPPLIVHDAVLPGASLVVRGGLKNPDHWRGNANGSRRAYARCGVDRYAVSAFAGLDVPAIDLVHAGPIVNGRICRSHVARIEEAGFTVQLTNQPRHVDIWLPDIAPETLDALIATFDEPEPNPARGV